MLTMIIVGALLVLLVGLVAKKICDHRGDPNYLITWGEFAVASLVMLAIVIPLTAWSGFSIAHSSAIAYEEFWHGFETEAQWIKTDCHRDGSCAHYYNCDPYTVRVPYDCSYYTGSGKNRRRVSRTCHRNETRYHHCPYVTQEWSFVVKTTLGDYTIASHNLQSDPDSHRWRAGHAVPSNIPSGIPQFWQAAKDRLDENKPGPVTQQRSYQNLILASHHTILKKYSSDIQRYKEAGLLPKLGNPNIHDFYWANRVYFVGVNPSGDWQKAARYFNAAFGSNLQGDLYTVVVDANKVTDPDTYVWALTAYWQSPEFEKLALSKNSFIVVLGSKDGQTVEWARAATGMPKGNEALLIDIKNKMPGTKLTPEAVFGPPGGELVGGAAIRITHSQGVLESLIWGANKFDRIHMKDYGYLDLEIEPSDSQKTWMYVLIVLFGCIAWGVCIAVGPKSYHHLRRH